MYVKVKRPDLKQHSVHIFSSADKLAKRVKVFSTASKKYASGVPGPN